ncbi:hypothetical protein Tco_0539459 [Tanacetum coccineum]
MRKLKCSGDLNSSRLSDLKCFLDDRNSHSGSLRSIRRIQWKWIRYINQLNEYAVLDRELDTPYPMEVDTPYSAVDQNMLLGPEYTKDESFRSSPTILSNSNFSKDPSKVTPIEFTAFMVAGPEDSGSLPQKRKKPKYKKTPTKTKVTPPPEPTEDSEQCHSVSSGTIPDPQYPERNIHSAESDDEDVLKAGEDMDEDTQADKDEHQSPPNTDRPESSPSQETQESDSNPSKPELKKYDNILPLTKRQLVKYLRKGLKQWVWKSVRYGVSKDWIWHIGGFLGARIRRIFLDGYGILVFRIVIFKISSFKLQNARLLLTFTKRYLRSSMAKIQEVLHVIDDNFRPTYDIEPLEQNADENNEDERVELANLIANLKLDIDENKKIQKQLRKANATLTNVQRIENKAKTINFG